MLAILATATGCERMYFREAAVPPAPPSYSLDAWPYREYWTGVVFNGEKIGLTHLALLPVAGRPGEYELRSEALLAFHFLGLNKQVTLKAQDWVADDLRLERFAYDYDLDGNKLKLTGIVQQGQLVVERETAGKLTRDAIPLPGVLYPTSAIALFPSLHGLGVGRQHRYLVYDGQLQELATVSQTIETYQESDLYDGRAYRIETELGGQHSTLWINDRAEPVLERAWRGLLFSTLETERQAKGYLAQASVNKRDLLVEFSRVRANISLPDPRAATTMQVVLQELPDSFAVPSDPVVAARIRMINEDGGNAFTEYQTPEAVIALKQGFGRLIRSEDDRGVLVILDHRMVRKPYGRVFFESLPHYRKTDKLEEVRAFMREC